MTGPADNSFRVRSFQSADRIVCRQLYVDGLIGGQLSLNDTGFDIDEIEASYMHQPGNHFWVAIDNDGTTIGMIGVQSHDQGTAEIRRLRVRTDRQRRGIGKNLMETALAFCQQHGFLKVTLDTFVEREPAMRLFAKFNFRHQSSKTIEGKDLHYFYLDLYSGEAEKG